jgi:hypothetical protein
MGHKRLPVDRDLLSALPSELTGTDRPGWALGPTAETGGPAGNPRLPRFVPTSHPRLPPPRIE